MTELLTSSALVRAIALALVEFLWQGAVVGAITAVALVALRRTSAQLRYVVGCASLATMCALPIVTATRQFTVAPVRISNQRITPTASDASSRLHALPFEIAPTESSRPRAWLEPRLPIVFSIWSAGVLMLGVQLLYGWTRIRRMSTSQERPDSAVETALRQMAARLGVTRSVRVIASTLSEVPAVIGWFRPAIVVPASVVAGLPPAHLDAILAHELAHVRRWDYFVNGIQCVLEVLLFYHPAVWWISRQIRIEREHCCDDLAASVCTTRAVYAHALASLEELRGVQRQLAIAASGGHLLKRIRRQLDPQFVPAPTVSGGMAMGVVLTILLCVAINRAQEPQAPIVDPQPRPALITPPLVTPALITPTSPLPRTTPQGVTPPPQVAAPGAIAGRVKDQEGGTVPGATVTLSSTQLPAPQSTTTSTTGQFAFTNLKPGTYDVAVAQPGFKTWKTTFQLASTQNALDVTLQLGSLSEMVSVKADRGNVGHGPDVPANIPTPSSAAEAFATAKQLYQDEAFDAADSMTTRALELYRELNPTPPPHAPSSNPSVTGGMAPIRVGGMIREPKRIQYVEPVYPFAARAAQIEGDVTIEARIGRDGTVIEPHVVKSLPMLDAAALGAVRQWLYSPTQLNGERVDVMATITVVFALK